MLTARVYKLGFTQVREYVVKRALCIGTDDLAYDLTFAVQ